MITIFHIDLDDPAFSTPERSSWLERKERSRAAAFRTKCLSRRFVAAHVALRLILGRILDRHPLEIAFNTNRWGRPELPGGPFFSLSHSNSTGLVAVDTSAAVGVDVEHINESFEASWLRDMLCPDERAAQRDELARLWVRKEAVLKALGLGLSYPMSKVPVGFDAPDFLSWRSVRLTRGGAIEQLSLIDLFIGSREVAALARTGEDSRPSIRMRPAISPV